jgi:hypothetical protein
MMSEKKVLQQKKSEKIYMSCPATVSGTLVLTALIRSLKESNPQKTIAFFSALPHQEQVLRHNPNIAFFGKSSMDWFLYFRRKNVFILDQGKFPVSMCYDLPMARVFGEVYDVPVTNIRPEIFLTQDENEYANGLLSKFSGPIIAVQPFSQTSPAKNWLVEKWTELARALKGVTLLHLGLIKDPVIPGMIDLRGKLELRKAFAVIKRADAFVGIASGLSHAAAAFDKPSVVIFGGATAPANWGYDYQRIIENKIQCSPCVDYLRGGACPYGQLCMQQTDVKEVKMAIEQMLEELSGASQRNGVRLKTGNSI